MKYLDTKQILRIFWHPHQKLWNYVLVKEVEKIFPIPCINYRLIQIIIVLDTFIFFLWILFRRFYTLGIKNFLSKKSLPENITILYFDLGTHKAGKELTLMVESILPKLGKKFVAYGFDASQESYVQVRKKFDKKKNVWIFKRAFCNCNTVDGKIKLYHHDDGLGDSVYRKGTSFEEVKSSKFSDWLLENEVILCDKICLIRMNIEGAEYDVLKDLVECGLYKYIDGYFGMWDDLSKIDRQRDKAFRNFLLKHKIYPITFNGRDLGFSLRIKCIQYEVETCIQSGLRNMARLKKLPF